MRRILVTIALFTTLCLGITSFAYGLDSDTPSQELELSATEVATMQNALRSYQLGDNATLSILYNHDSIPKFILGQTDIGYAIVDRDTWVLLEKSEAQSIYTGYESEQNYYGGVGLYFVRVEAGFYDLVSGDALEQMPFISAIDDLGVPDTDADTSGGPSSQSITTFATGTDASLFHTEDIVRKLSFGLNGGSENNTCTAVACGLALNYLDQTVDSRIVSADKDAEYLDKNRFWDASRYPQTAKLHTYLVSDCNMTPG